MTPPAGPPSKTSPPPVLVAAAAGLGIAISSSIVGGLQIEEGVTLSMTDSILDATGPAFVAYAASGGSGGGALTLEGCTVIGKVHASLLSLVSDCIFRGALGKNDPWPGALWADRKQQGCVRFSYLPQPAVIPRNFKCVLEGVGVPCPLFQSLRYGDPDYCKLFASTDDTIRRGADDGGEMGAFHSVHAPQRETDLRVRLQEYVPVGLEFGIFYET
jgi:hypothetical protein